MFPSSPKGYGLPVVCTECSGSTDSTNAHTYPKDSECYSESLKTVENPHPNALSSKEHHRRRAAGTSLLHAQPCNGIASGKRLETDGTLYPSNHDRIRLEGAAGALLTDTHGTSFPRAPGGCSTALHSMSFLGGTSDHWGHQQGCSTAPCAPLSLSTSSQAWMAAVGLVRAQNTIIKLGKDLHGHG